MSLIASLPQINPRLVKEEKLRRKARESLTTFKRLLYRRYEHGKHLEALDRALEQVTRYVETGGNEGIGRLIVEMPPRHGKTLTVSRLYPAWHLGRNPDHRVMLVSYGATLAEKNSRLARNLIKSQRYKTIFNLELAKDSASVQSWEFDGYEGGADALGIQGGATGKGAHLLIIDDPVKNREEAESSTIREKTWDGYQDDLLTRLEPGGAIIIMMTRWHIDDLIGRVLKESPDDWTRLRFPAIAEENDPLGRKVGEALWPFRYAVKALEVIKRNRTIYSWLSLFQQRPIAREGGLFKFEYINSHRVDKLPDLKRIVIGVDPAVSSNKTSDETGIVAAALGMDGHGYILRDVSGILTPNGWATRVDMLYQDLKADRVIGEVNNGGDLVETNLRIVNPNLSFKSVHASKGKTIRAEPIAALYEIGKIHHVGKLEELEDQMCTWADGDDSPDRLDALVWALTELMLDGPIEARQRKNNLWG